MGKEGINIVTKALRAGDISEDDAPEVAAFLLGGFYFFMKTLNQLWVFFITYYNVEYN